MPAPSPGPSPSPAASPPPEYLAYPPPPADPRRRRRVLIVLGVAWAVILLVGGVWYAWHGQPSVREQTTIAQAQSTVDRAIGQVVTAAGPGVVPAVTGYVKVSDCSVTLLRSGATYQRVVWLFTAAGTEPEVLDRIAAGLPAGYHASTFHSAQGDVHSLAADAGDYVALRGTVEQPGLIKVTADTGCRPLGHRPGADPTGPPAPADRSAVDTMLAALGVAPATWAVHTLPCGLRTVEAATGPGQTVTALPEPTAATVVHTDNVFADPDGVAVRITGDRVVVSATTGTCS